MTRCIVGIVALVSATLVSPARAEDWQSRQASQLLLERMTAHDADAVAVRDPERPERFIAALRLPGQLLVVSATHPATDLVANRVEQGQFREVYMDLQGTPARDSKFFVHDMAADGISLEGLGAAYDVVHDGSNQLTCDGRWKDAKLKEDQYREQVTRADVRYARMLGLLSSAFEGAEASR